MSKKEVVQKIEIFSPYFRGNLEDMPKEAREKMKIKNPKMHKQIFEINKK